MSDVAAQLAREMIGVCQNEILVKSMTRIRGSVDQLSDEELWRRPNENLISVGNYMLHLAGNVRQWIVTSFEKTEDKRVRDLEFAERGPLPREEVFGRLESALRDASAALDKIGPDALLARHRVQENDITGVSIIIHVTEHFSYHTGQIVYYTKLVKDMDMQFPRWNFKKTEAK